jgi:hypothetical protein
LLLRSAAAALLLLLLLLQLACRPRQAEDVRRALVARHRQPGGLVAAAKGQAVDDSGVDATPQLAQLGAIGGGEDAHLEESRRARRE